MKTSRLSAAAVATQVEMSRYFQDCSMMSRRQVIPTAVTKTSSGGNSVFVARLLGSKFHFDDDVVESD